MTSNKILVENTGWKSSKNIEEIEVVVVWLVV